MKNNPILKIENLGIEVENKQVVKDFSIEVGEGELHVLLGPNGSGKSSFAAALMGDVRYVVNQDSRVEFLDVKNFSKLDAGERARRGLYVAWQSPMTIPGVKVFTMFKTMWEARGNRIESVVEFKEKLEDILQIVGLPKEYIGRSVNEGFSGGEKKRLELAQMILLRPKLTILDEIDSGLDVDALKMVGNVVNELVVGGGSLVVITHYKRLIDYISPTKVHVMREGSIVSSGGLELVEEVERNGYRSVIKDR